MFYFLFTYYLLGIYFIIVLSLIFVNYDIFYYKKLIFLSNVDIEFGV